MTWVMTIVRVLLAVEFSAALGAWGLGICAWPVAGAVSTCALVTFMLTWGGEPGYADARDAEPITCRVFGCTHAGDPLWGQCGRCGGRP